jgi:carboxyl-terminal processing protease
LYGRIIEAAAALVGLAFGSMLTISGMEWPRLVLQDKAWAAVAAAPSAELGAFYAAFDQIRTHYTEPPDADKLVGWAIGGLLRGLDTHSAYLDEQTFRDMEEEARGVFGGLGIEVTEADGLVKVVAVAARSHAAKADIRPGDIITQLDRASIQGLTIKQVVEKMRGPVHSKILLRVRRTAVDQVMDVWIERDLIHVRSVAARVEGGDVGYIGIAKFNGLTFQGMRTAIHDLASKVPARNLKGYIIDLRNNPGGLVDQAILVASVFLKQGEVVSTKGRNSADVYRLKANDAPRELISDKPVIVLINGGTASAAEIVAGALQDHQRATLVGTRSYGKGSVQTVTSLGPGNGALKLTTAWYFTPAGRSIQATGISPDIEVLQEVPADGRAATETDRDATPEAGGTAKPGELQSFIPLDKQNDKALHLALELLRAAKVKAAVPPKAEMRN